MIRESWRERYPNGEVLSDNTGHRRNYQRTPYRGYETNDRVLFPVPHYRDDPDIKDLITGVEVNGNLRAMTFGYSRAEGLTPINLEGAV